MNTIGELRGILKSNLGLHKSRLDCLCNVLVGLILVCSVNLSKLATTFGTGASFSSNYRRLQRFFTKIALSDLLIAYVCLKLFKPTGKVVLMLDRTNWQFGKKPINILMLSIQCGDIAVPFLWDLLPKKGNSNYNERLSLMRRFTQNFPSLEVECLLMDREFIGEDWLKWLDAQGIRFIVRAKKNFVVASHKGKNIPIRKCFNSINRKGRCLSKTREIFGLALWISGKRLDDGEILITLSNKHRKTALDWYQKRWLIETLFGNLKTRGFRLEDTHITAQDKLKSLICVLSLAYCWAYLSGQWLANIIPIKIKKHGRKEKSVFTLGIQTMRQLFFNKIIENLSFGCPTYPRGRHSDLNWLEFSG